MTEQTLFCDAVAPHSEVLTQAPAAAPALRRPAIASRRRPAHDVRSFTTNALLFAEGAPALHLHVIMEGTVMLFKLLPDGRRHILDIVGPGAMIGMTSDTAYSLSAKAITGGSIRMLTRHQVEESAELSAELHRQALVRLDAMQSHALRLGRMSAGERVASFLWRLASLQGATGGNENAEVAIGLSLGEIADHLGLVQETVCRNLAALKKAGVIVMPRPDRFQVLDADELSRLGLSAPRLCAAA